MINQIPRRVCPGAHHVIEYTTVYYRNKLLGISVVYVVLDVTFIQQDVCREISG